jgi:hypothetical protein
VLEEGAPEGAGCQLAQRLVAGGEGGILAPVPVGEEGGYGVGVDAGQVEPREALGVLADHARRYGGDLPGRSLREHCHIRFVDTHGIGVLLHQGDLASVDAAAGERHHRQHPYRLRGLAGVTGHDPGQRTGRTRRKTGRNAIGKAQHDRRRGLDGATISIGHPARAVREGNVTHGTQDRPGLGFRSPG